MAALLIVGLQACEPRNDRAAAPGPAHPDTIAAAGDTLAAPIAAEDDVAAGAQARASLQPVGQRDARGAVYLSRAAQGLRVVAEVGGFDEQRHFLDVLDRPSCDRIETAADAEPIARLGEMDVLDDGTGRLETEIPNVMLDGPRGVMGRAITLRHADGSVAACGVVGPAVG